MLHWRDNSGTNIFIISQVYLKVAITWVHLNIGQDLCYKLFTVVSNSNVCYFVYASYLHQSLTFVGKARNLPSEWGFVKCSTWVDW